MLIKRKILLIFFILLIPLVISYEASSPSYQIEIASTSIGGNNYASSNSYTIEQSGNTQETAGAFTSASYEGMAGVLKFETAAVPITPPTITAALPTTSVGVSDTNVPGVTNFLQVHNLRRVDRPTFGKENIARLKFGKGSKKFDVRNKDFAQALQFIPAGVNTGPTVMVDINELGPEFNTPSEITLNGVKAPFSREELLYAPGTFSTAQELQRDAKTCPTDICYDVNYNPSNEELSFTVAHFSGFSYGGNANLTINDSAEGTTANTSTAIGFFAYYINSTNGNHITGATCNITFDDGNGVYSMTEEVANQRYFYNKTSGFTNPGTHEWNVSCDSTDFTQLDGTDDIIITSSSATCGDGNVDPGEQCDDNNNVNGDGCSSTCQIEGGSPPPVPEFSDYAIALLLLTVVGGFVAMRRRQE